MPLRLLSPSGRSIGVLVLFLALLLFDPFIPGGWVNVAFLVIAVASAWILARSGAAASVVMALLVLAFVTAHSYLFFFTANTSGGPRETLALTVFVVTIALFGYCFRLLVAALWKATEVGTDQIVSAVNIYLVLGVSWAYVYALVAWFDPASFDLRTGETETLSTLIYFSFVTLASLGYGDIVPKTHFAQRLAVLEAVMGQFYMAVLVAYLVSLYINRKSLEK